MDFNITEELAVLIKKTGTTAGANLYEVKKMLQSLDITIQKLASQLLVGRNSGVFSLITIDMKNTVDRDFIICHS
jgi:hypothetical protein